MQTQMTLATKKPVASGVGFLLATVLAAGVVSGCYTLTGQPLGGNKSEPSPCEGREPECVYFSEDCPQGDFQCLPLPKDAANGADAKDSADSKSVDAGPQATYPDGADGGTCYADVCAMPKECPADAPPVCWWLCPKFKKKWKGEQGTSLVITYKDGEIEGYCDPGQCLVSDSADGWCISPGDNGPYVKPPPPATPTDTLTFEDDGSLTAWCSDCTKKTHFTNIE